MSVVQALAAMLSAGADASSRLGAASLAANASNANANAALQGDIYRSNTQGQIANRGIESENQRAAAELALRGRLANNQMGLESGRLALQRQQLGLGREQLGLNRQQLNQERDFRLGEMGQGQYAPKVPDMGQVDGDVIKALKGVLAGRANGAADGDIIEAMNGVLAASGAGADSGNLQDYAKKMIMANPGNQRVLATWGPILNQGSQQQQWQQEFDWKKGAMSDPNVLFGALAPHILGMEGMTPDRMSPALQQLRTSLGINAKSPTDHITPQSMDLGQATQTLAAPQTAELLKALGITDQSTPWQIGNSIGERAGSLTPADLTEIQRIMAAWLKAKPDMFDSGSPDHPGVKLLRKLLDSPISSMNPAQMQSDYATQRQEYYKNGGDPRTTMMFGIPRLW